MIKNELLASNGFVVVDFLLIPKVLELLLEKNWEKLDHYFLEISKNDGILRNFLSRYLDFKTLEHIIAIRRYPDDEDGIWHDDGSRLMGFSLSLNLAHKSISGGELRFKLKSSNDCEVFPPLPYGKMVLFLSGIFGYEHMVSAVTQGERVVIAGWCS